MMNAVVVVAAGAFLVVYASHLPESFYRLGGLIILVMNMLFVITPRHRQIAKKYSSKPGIAVLPLGGAILGLATMIEGAVPRWETWMGKIGILGSTLAVLGLFLIDFRVQRSEGNRR